MKVSEYTRPISYLRANASKVIREVVKNQKVLVITRHGEAKVVIQEVRAFEQTQESLALLKMLAQSSTSIKAGKAKPVKKAFSHLRKRAHKTPKLKPGAKK